MRILFTRFPLESRSGGAENQTMWLWEGLAARGHQVQFLGSCPVLLARARELAISNWQLVIGSTPVTKWSAIAFLWKRKNMRKKLIKTLEKLTANGQLPQAICMLSLSEKLLLTEWVAAQGMKVVWIEHDSVGRWLRKNPWLPMLKRASKFATIVCVSELSRKLYIEMGFDAESVIAIPDGVPAPSLPSPSPSPHPSSIPAAGMSRPGVSAFEPSATRRRSYGETLVVGCISRLSPEKGIDILIEAIADIPEITLQIIGTGPQEGYLRKLIAEDAGRMGTERIHIDRHVPDLDNFYDSLDAFVLPSSHHDPFGLVAAEAMIRGVPTIVTDACGIAGYLCLSEDALVAHAGSVESLRSKLREMMKEEVQKRLSENGRKTAMNSFSLETMVKRYEEVLG